MPKPGSSQEGGPSTSPARDDPKGDPKAEEPLISDDEKEEEMSIRAELGMQPPPSLDRVEKLRKKLNGIKNRRKSRAKREAELAELKREAEMAELRRIAELS